MPPPPASPPDSAGSPASPGRTALDWLLRLVAAGILGSTLFFKFTAAPESVALFERLGAEPFGRLGLGAVELVAVVLLLVPRTVVEGALLTVGLMLGVLGTHLTVLGIEVDGDGGALFGMALAALAAAAGVLLGRRAELLRRPWLARRLPHGRTRLPPAGGERHSR
jgi:hypothetical protein